MNISKAARKALIPIEREISKQPVEHLYLLNKTGKILSKAIGTAKNVNILLVPPDSFIATHNHPSGSRSLSPIDIYGAIYWNLREIRAVTKKELCHLAEIPKLDIDKKNKCLSITEKYIILSKCGKDWNLSLYRKMRKELKKSGGLKFRTIKLSKTEAPSIKFNVFSKLWNKLLSKF